MGKLVRSYFKMRTKLPVWLWLNKKAIKLFNKNSPRIDETQKRIIDDLTKNGIAVTHVDELWPGENKLARLQNYAKELEEAGTGEKTSKTFLTYLLPVKPVLDIENILIKLAVHEKVLAVINSYLGMFSKFYYFTLNITHPVPDGTNPEQSQRWHRDPEDIKMAKMFIYLNDVDEGTGPFIYVPQSNFGGKWNKIFPQRPPIGYYPPDGELEKIIPPGEIKKFVARAGTIIFADTAGLHKGGYATQKERVMLTVGYSSSSSPLAEQYSLPGNAKEKVEKLSPAQKYAILFKPSKFNSYLLRKFRKFFKNTA